MNENQLESVKRRVKKLLALTKSPNENEATIAVKLANNLISQYKLNNSDFDEYISKSVKSTKRYVEWHALVANAVENIYATYHIRDVSTGNFIFFGEELDVFMSTQMYSYLTKTINRMVKENVRKNAKSKYRQAYRSGIANRLWERMFELGFECSWRNIEELTSKKKEICEWVNSQHELIIRSSKESGYKVNKSAFKKGMIDAEGVNLNRQMTGCGNRRIEG